MNKLIAAAGITAGDAVVEIGPGRVLAAAGLRRLGLGARISVSVPIEECVPAPGQGIIAIEIRTDSTYVEKCFNQNWHERWRRDDSWKGSNGPVKNRDLWERLFGRGRLPR